MKKALLLILIALYCYIAHAQNYRCLQPGVKRFFTNTNGYLRGMRIDSVKTYTDSTIFFPFHTPRGPYDDMSIPVLDTNGGSWLGKKVIELTDGTTIFDSYWKDSVIIKTRANVGDTWIFYSDSGNLYYKATVIAKDTMTVLSTLDSIKTIRINTFNSSGPVADTLDNLIITLSKNNGFVRTFDLYTFPYHKPDSLYRPGLDFFLDRPMLPSYRINNFGSIWYFGKDKLTFQLVDFINPNEQQLHNWNTGDILESYHECGDIGGGFGGPVYSQFIISTITSKVVTAHTIDYILNGSTASHFCGWSIYVPGVYINSAGLYSFNDTVYSILQPSEMPEDHFNYGSFTFYYPDDTSYCSKAPLYLKVPFDYCPFSLGCLGKRWTIKLGIGLVDFHYVDGNPSFENTSLIYFNINGVSCGTIKPVAIDNDPVNTATRFTPNPASNELTIKTNNKGTYTICLQNLLGQTIKHLQTSKPEETINVSDWASGIYFVNVIDESGNRSSTKVLVAH